MEKIFSILTEDNLSNTEALSAAIVANNTAAAEEIVFVVKNTAELSAKLDAATGEKDTLTTSILELQEKLTNALVELNVSNEINTELSNKVKELSNASIKLEAPSKTASVDGKSFMLDGEEYGFCYPAVNHNKVKLTMADVIASVELQKELVAVNSSFVYKK